MALLAGTYQAQVLRWKFGTASTGTEQIELEFFVPSENENIRSYLYFSDAAWQRSVEALKVCGWDGRDFGSLDGIGSVEVEIVVAEEVYKDKISYRVKWINPLGGGGMKNEMDEPQKKAFVARMQQRLRGMKPAPATSKSPPKKPAPPPTKGSESPPPHEDDEIPF
jgi:hypothetical protein